VVKEIKGKKSNDTWIVRWCVPETALLKIISLWVGIKLSIVINSQKCCFESAKWSADLLQCLVITFSKLYCFIKCVIDLHIFNVRAILTSLHITELDMGPFLLTQSNQSTHGSNPIQSIKLPENPDPIQSNPKIAGIKSSS